MITSVTIENLRGIRAGTLEDLTPLTILVGPNGSGKSTVIDALHIAGSPIPAEAVGQTVARRQGMPHGAEWLISQPANDRQAAVSITTTVPGPKEFGRRIGLVPVISSSTATETIIRCFYRGWLHHVHFDKDNRYEFEEPTRTNSRHLEEPGTVPTEPYNHPVPGVDRIALIDPASDHASAPLYELYSGAVKAGLRNDAVAVMKTVVPGLANLEILTEKGQPVLHFVFAHGSVPVTIAGDGLKALARITLDLASRSGGVVLLEEPEVHQHPRAIWQTAAVILASLRRDIQVILSTHSLELIQTIVRLAGDQLDQVGVFRTVLSDGALQMARFAGEELDFALNEVEEDLR